MASEEALKAANTVVVVCRAVTVEAIISVEVAVRTLVDAVGDMNVEGKRGLIQTRPGINLI
jgi:hypothetical protein